MTHQQIPDEIRPTPTALLKGAAAIASIALLAAGCAEAPSMPGVGQGAETRQRSAAADPFTPELESRIEAYVASDRAPTGAENQAERAQLLWEWLNAWALAGHTLPVDMTQAVHTYRQLVAQEVTPSPTVLAQIDRYLAELALLREDPEALGGTRFASDQPLTAGSWETIEQVYTAGTHPPREGAVFLLGLHFMSDEGTIQFEDPAGDNYVTARVSREGAALEPFRQPWASMHAGAGRGTPMVAYRLAGADLEPGDTVTFVYGDRSGGSRGFAVQTMSTERLVLPVYVDLDGAGKFFSPSWDSRTVVGTPEVASLDVFAPPVVRPGEPVVLAVRAADRWWNRPTGPIPGWEVLLDGEPVAQVPAGGAPIAEVTVPALEAPGTYRYDVRSADGALAARSNPVWVEAAPAPHVVFGELHAHTDFAEAQGTPEEFYRYAIEDAQLDFFSLTEHDAWLDAGEWRTLQELTTRSNAEGRSIAFLGYEWTSQRPVGGHHNVIFRRDSTPLVPVAENPTLPELYRGLAAVAAAGDVIVIPHAHEAGDWTTSDPELERLVEIYSMHGTFEWFGNLYLKNGWEVGFIAASDDHRTKPGLARASYLETLGQRGGLAAAIVPEVSADAVFDALRGLSAYATSGERILLAADLDGRPMGTRQAAGGERRLRARVAGTAPIERLNVVRNGEVVLSRSYATAPLTPGAWLQIGFESSSEVFPPESGAKPGAASDNPRLYRFWDGTLRIDGARVEGVDTGGIDNPYNEYVRSDPAAGHLRYHLETRGRRDVFFVRLDGASPSTTLTFDIAEGREFGVSGRIVRPPAESLPPVRFSVRLGELADGRFEREIPFEQYVDRITVQVVDREAAWDRELDWVDLESAGSQSADYYYLRVDQQDGGRAWSSPWWVGGEARKREPGGSTSGR